VAKQLFNGVYRGRKVFVTGASGFKGSWLCHWLTELGARVTGFSLYLPSRPCHFEVIRLNNRIRHVKGDVRDIAALNKAMEKAKPEIVFHLAAQPIVRASYDDPVTTFETNLLGTVNVLEAIRRLGSVRAAVIVTSDKCYENLEKQHAYKEVDRLGGKDPYSASKACAEMAFSAYFSSFFASEREQRGGLDSKKNSSVSIATARAGNVIGGGDWARDRVVPDCVRSWSKGESPILRHPRATRPWQHVLEPISGYLWLGARLFDRDRQIHGEAFNFGPAPQVNESVESLVRHLRLFWPSAPKPKIAADDREKPEARLLRLDCRKAAKQLSWRATLSFSETARLTANWYRNYFVNRSKASHLTSSQILEFAHLAKKRKLAWAGR
jgi:CDP-glucose 4,6-dehydratase